MKYTPATIAKALFAFLAAFSAAATGAAHGVDLSGLDFGGWMTAVGAGLVAGGGVFAIPNKDANPVQGPADQAVSSIQQTVQDAIAATAGLQQVKQTVDDLINTFPGGSAVEQAIKSLRFPGI